MPYYGDEEITTFLNLQILDHFNFRSDPCAWVSQHQQKMAVLSKNNG